MRFPIAALLVLVVLAAGCSTPGGSGGGTTPTGGGSSGARFTSVTIGAGGPEPRLAIGADGVAIIAAQDAGGGAPHVWMTSDAKTFRPVAPSAQSGGEIDVAVGASGAIYFTQLGPNGNVVAHSTDGGASWSSALLGTTQYFDREWATVDASGNAFIVARQFGNNQAAVVSRSTDGGITFLARGNAWDATHEPGDSNGNLLAYANGVALAYVCRGFDGICVATSKDAGATWTQHLVVQRGVGADNVYPIVAADGGRLVVAWSDASGGDLAVFAARSDDDGSTWTQPAKVSAAGESATLPWLDVRAGRAWVAYVSAGPGIASADAAVGARWSVQAARLDVGSLAVQARGAPFDGAVHVGPISHPAGHPGQSGAFDRSFGDFLSLSVDAAGKPWIVSVDTAHGAARDLLARGS